MAPFWTRDTTRNQETKKTRAVAWGLRILILSCMIDLVIPSLEIFLQMSHKQKLNGDLSTDKTACMVQYLTYRISIHIFFLIFITLPHFGVHFPLIF